MIRDARERERFANKPSQTLSQGILPALQHAPFLLFPSRPLDAARAANHRLISTPKIGVTQSGTVCVRNGFPQTAAGFFTSISHCISNHLSRLSTQSYPDPRLIRLLQHKRAIRSSNSSTVASASFASGGITVSLKAGSCAAFFYPGDH